MIANARGINKIKKSLIQEMKEILNPYLWDSGYLVSIDKKKGYTGKSRPYRIWMPKDKSNKPTFHTYLLNGYVIESLEGFTEDGVLIETYSGGCVTGYWEELPLEDLALLKKWLTKRLGAAS